MKEANIDLVLKGMVGSKAYGLDHALSDEDWGGIYVAPFRNAIGLPNFLKTDSTVNGNDPDFAYHEITKYLRLATECNPTVLELLWLEDYEVLTPVGEKLISLREGFISTQAVKGRYLGYATSQLERYWKEPEDRRKPKHIRHCFRLMIQAIQLLNEGQLTVRLTDEQIDLVRSIELLEESVMRQVFGDWETRILNDSRTSSLQNDNKRAKDLAQGFLINLRRDQATNFVAG